jgi:diguanylate cyclase (GGDEF)-like protein
MSARPAGAPGTRHPWGGWGATDGRRRARAHALDTARDGVHSALVPPGALHRRVTAALANWQLDDAEALLADTERDPSPYVAPEPSPRRAAVRDDDGAPQQGGVSLGRAWADTLRAELLVRRLRMAGFTLVGEPVRTPEEPTEPALDLHAGLVGLIEGAVAPDDDPGTGDPRAEDASRAAEAIALVRSAKAAFEATDDDLQRAAGLARHARIELLSRRIDAAMDEAVEAASLLDPGLPPGRLLVDTLTTLAGVLADLELMPLALDYQRRAHEAAAAAAADPAVLGPDDGPADVLVATAATRLGELCAELGEGLLEDGAADAAAPHFAEGRQLAEQALRLLPPDAPGLVAAQVVHGWALVGLGETAAATGPLRAAVRRCSATGDRALLASAQLALGRALRRQGDSRAADDHLAQTLALASEHGLPRLRRAALRELCTLHSELDDAGRALPYLQAYIADELDRVDERRTRWVELFGRRKSLLETERAAGQLRRQAYEDTLTHLPNRRYAEARLDGLLSAGAAPALAVVDVDRFKSINDAVGHPGGDAVLRRIGELLVAGVRDSDEVCRWAGDEFVILFPETTAEQAERALERIRAAVAGSDWASLGLTAPVTISVGIASAARGDDRRTLFAAADGVLYDAKRSGRDRVVRLSAVTQTRADDPPPAEEPADHLAAPADHLAAPADHLAAPADHLPAAADRFPAPADHLPAAAERPVQPGAGPADRVRDAFAGLLVEPLVSPADPPLWSGSTVDPPLGSGGSAPLPPRPVPGPARPAAAPQGSPAAEPEVVWAPGRSTAQVLAAVREARAEDPDRTVVVLRAAADTLAALAGEHGGAATVDPEARAAALGLPAPGDARVTVLCAGGADAGVAAEAAFVARVAGARVVRSDLVRRQPDPAALAGTGCAVVVTGADASLVGAVRAATDAPVLALPTSAGAAGSFGALGALVAALGAGVPVVEADNGCAAGLTAARIARG